MVAESTPAARDPAPHDAPTMLETIELNGEDSAPSARARSAKIDQKMASKDLENGDAKSLNGPDDTAEQAPRHAASDERTFVNAIIAFLGSGILGLPYAFRRTGIVYGLATLVAVAVVSTYAMLLVVECKYKLKTRGITITTYGDIGFHAMGRTGRILVDTAIVVSQAGFCVAYLIFIVTNAHQFLGIDKALVVSVCAPPLIAFSLLRHMKELAYVALAADVMNFVGLAVVYTADLSFMAQRDASSIEVLGVVSSIPFFFGVASYCFEGVGMVLPLENGMEHPTHFKSILICTVIIITTLYATFGICGYLAFGDTTLDVVTLNLTDDSGLLSLVKLCLCAGLFFAYPIMMFPVFQILEPLVASAHNSDAPVPRVTQNQKIVMMKSVVVVTTAALAVGIPNFGQFISFIGSTCCTLLAFVLPSCFHLILFPRETSWPKAVLLAALIALGVAAVVAAVADTGKKIFG